MFYGPHVQSIHDLEDSLNVFRVFNHLLEQLKIFTHTSMRLVPRATVSNMTQFIDFIEIRQALR